MSSVLSIMPFLISHNSDIYDIKDGSQKNSKSALQTPLKDIYLELDDIFKTFDYSLGDLKLFGMDFNNRNDNFNDIELDSELKESINDFYALNAKDYKKSLNICGRWEMGFEYSNILTFNSLFDIDFIFIRSNKNFQYGKHIPLQVNVIIYIEPDDEKSEFSVEHSSIFRSDFDTLTINIKIVIPAYPINWAGIDENTIIDNSQFKNLAKVFEFNISKIFSILKNINQPLVINIENVNFPKPNSECNNKQKEVKLVYKKLILLTFIRNLIKYRHFCLNNDKISGKPASTINNIIKGIVFNNNKTNKLPIYFNDIKKTIIETYNDLVNSVVDFDIYKKLNTDGSLFNLEIFYKMHKGERSTFNVLTQFIEDSKLIKSSVEKNLITHKHLSALENILENIPHQIIFHSKFVCNLVGYPCYSQERIQYLFNKAVQFYKNAGLIKIKGKLPNLEKRLMFFNEKFFSYYDHYYSLDDKKDDYINLPSLGFKYILEDFIFQSNCYKHKYFNAFFREKSTNIDPAFNDLFHTPQIINLMFPIYNKSVYYYKSSNVKSINDAYLSWLEKDKYGKDIITEYKFDFFRQYYIIICLQELFPIRDYKFIDAKRTPIMFYKEQDLISEKYALYIMGFLIFLLSIGIKFVGNNLYDFIMPNTNEEYFVILGDNINNIIKILKLVDSGRELYIKQIIESIYLFGLKNIAIKFLKFLVDFFLCIIFILSKIKELEITTISIKEKIQEKIDDIFEILEYWTNFYNTPDYRINLLGITQVNYLTKEFKPYYTDLENHLVYYNIIPKDHSLPPLQYDNFTTEQNLFNLNEEKLSNLNKEQELNPIKCKLKLSAFQSTPPHLAQPSNDSKLVNINQNDDIILLGQNTNIKFTDFNTYISPSNSSGVDYFMYKYLVWLSGKDPNDNIDLNDKDIIIQILQNELSKIDPSFLYMYYNVNCGAYESKFLDSSKDNADGTWKECAILNNNNMTKDKNKVYNLYHVYVHQGKYKLYIDPKLLIERRRYFLFSGLRANEFVISDVPHLKVRAYPCLISLSYIKIKKTEKSLNETSSQTAICTEINNNICRICMSDGIPICSDDNRLLLGNKSEIQKNYYNSEFSKLWNNNDNEFEGFKLLDDYYKHNMLHRFETCNKNCKAIYHWKCLMSQRYLDRMLPYNKIKCMFCHTSTIFLEFKHLPFFYFNDALYHGEEPDSLNHMLDVTILQENDKEKEYILFNYSTDSITSTKFVLVYNKMKDDFNLFMGCLNIILAIYKLGKLFPTLSFIQNNLLIVINEINKNVPLNSENHNFQYSQILISYIDMFLEIDNESSNKNATQDISRPISSKSIVKCISYNDYINFKLKSDQLVNRKRTINFNFKNSNKKTYLYKTLINDSLDFLNQPLVYLLNNIDWDYFISKLNDERNKFKTKEIKENEILDKLKFRP